MINFDTVDLSERHPEEVISFFWRSVYKEMWQSLYIIAKMDWKCLKGGGGGGGG